jgi:hypothetical protein
MKNVSALAVLPLLFVLSLRGDTIELKTGERIDGTFKQATSAGALIEVAGQSITIPLDRVQAIYFGAVPVRTAAGPPASQEALSALRALRSVTGSGITLREYATRVLDARVTVDRYLSQGSDGRELRRAIRAAMVEYELAYRAWQANSGDWNLGFSRAMGETMQDPEVARCPTVQTVTARVDNPQPQPLKGRSPRPPSSPPDRATMLGLELSNISGGSLAPGIWACASAQVSQAEQSLTATASPSLPPAPARAAAVTANSDPAEVARIAAVRLADMGRGTPEQAQLIQKGHASICAVVTVPPGAEIEVDGKRPGISPVAFVLLKQGDTPRKVTIKMTGYTTVEKSVVPDGRAIPIGLALEKQ